MTDQTSDPRAAAAPDSDVQRAVQPQPPTDSRPNPPEPPTDARPKSEIPEPPTDSRPPNPLDDDKPDKSAPKADWVTYAEAHGIQDADKATKDDLIARVG